MSEKIKRAVLLGPQASGKSTQAKVITDFLHVPLISASQVLKGVVNKNNDLGNKIKDIMDRGELVPDKYMVNLMLEKLGGTNCLTGFLLDGFPRNIAQAEALDAGCGVDKVFNIEISDEEAIRRIVGRRMCSNGHVFHLEYQPSKQGNICDICGEELVQRDDDQAEIVKKRLSIYRDETSKLFEYYKKQGKLHFFDGEHSIEKVSANILDYLKSNVG